MIRPDSPSDSLSPSVIPVVADFCVVIDTREQLPWQFDGLYTDMSARGGRRPLVVEKAVATLRQGDYSIRGFENQVAIERKSLPDLFGTLGRGRDRFARELERLAALDRAAVVIESGLDGITPRPCEVCDGKGLAPGGEWELSRCVACSGTGKRPAVERSRLHPKTIIRSYLAWSIEYPTISWHWAEGRRLAEVLAFRWLARWHKVRAGAVSEQKGG